MEKIDYLLKYLSELQVQWHEANACDGPQLEVYARIVEVNDLIEVEIAVR